MSTEIVDTPKAGTNEYPDIVGAKPENPYLASFRPYIPASVNLREFTLLPIIVGTLLGMIFGASSLYLVLKTGLTVSASIPVGVISITLFRALAKMGMRSRTILENNIVQTAGSAGESIAFGVGVTMPAILILGFDLEVTRVLLVAVLGGLLGILMMIPLRRALIVQQHGLLKYPEGTACAEVLKAGADEESRAAAHTDTSAPVADVRALPIFTGLGIGFIYKVAMDAFKAWKDTPERVFGPPFNAGSIAAEINPALLGVGYIIGPHIAAIMCAGGVLSYLVLIPLIKFFGEGIAGVLPPGTVPISQMSHNDIRNAYVLYIGAGAVAAGGIISVFKSLPMIWHGLKGGMKDVGTVKAQGDAVPRTERDLPMKLVLGGSILLVVMIAFANPLYAGGVGVVTRIAAAILIVIFGFLFVTVSSRLTGEIGSSSNPISGMTVATLLLTCLIFLLLHWTGQNYYVTALSLGAIVCIASSNGGTTSQALKTGHLLGATPKAQQYAILIGALGSAVILGPILLTLNNAGTVYVPVANDPAIAFPADFRVNPSELQMDGSQPKSETLHGPQGTKDPNSYHVWFYTPAEGANAVKYLVNDEGVPVYIADPAINGIHKERPDGGGTVTKFDAPKATLMSYIIKGILSQKLPWGLVLLGAMISIVLEMAGIPSLAFAVGVYLPLSASSPILIGGLIRWGVDKYVRKKFARHEMTEDQLIAEGDKSPGVLMASGYIAGGALAGIIFAVMNGLESLQGFNKNIGDWADTKNPFFSGANSNLLSLIPFVIICILLYLAGREVILAGKKNDADT